MIVQLSPRSVLGLLRPLDAGRRHLNVKIAAAAGRLTVSVLGYEATLPARVERAGAFHIPYRVFAELLREGSAEREVRLEADPAWLRLGRHSARLHDYIMERP